MDFAKKLLNKYGWNEGDGLGKNNNGITKPIKANLKFDTAGIGVTAASDFNNHWWDRVFNEAAQNVQVNKEQDGVVSMDLKDAEASVEISTKTYSVKKLKKAKETNNDKDAKKNYGNFLQASMLIAEGYETETKDKIDLADVAFTQFKTLTDEELFKSCGGRTAHKGARHGLKLSGKLARIEMQEKELLAKMMEKRQQVNEETKPKKIKKKEIIEDDNAPQKEESDSVQDNQSEHKVKKIKRKHKELSGELVVAVDTPNDVPTKSKKKKLKGGECELILNPGLETEEVEMAKKTKRTSKKTKTFEQENSDADCLPAQEHIVKKKKKKNKRKEE